jgi:hypothetical protein
MDLVLQRVILGYIFRIDDHLLHPWLAELAFH